MKIYDNKDIDLIMKVWYRNSNYYLYFVDSKTFKFKPAEESSVSRIIKDLNPKKATGADCIPARALVSVHDIVAPAYTRLYNTCIQKASFPMEAKKSEVSPVYKKDSALERKNHRPVSMLNSLSKILEKIMDNVP